MKRYKLLIAAALMAVLGLGGVSLAQATSGEGTFSVTEVSDDTAELRMGSNLFLAGNLVSSDKSSQPNVTDGLLFAAGNQLGLENQSEYGFIAGNAIDYRGKTEKDLFVAGNLIKIHDGAKVGRDAFIAGNEIVVDADMPGDLSVTGAKVVINGINVKGDLNLDVDRLVIEGKANVDGKLVINADADITGIEKLTYAEMEKYENLEYDVTATEILVSKILSIAALFVAFAVIMAMFPAVKQRVARELNVTQFGKDVLIGMMVLLFVPIIIIFLLISIVGAPAALLLLGTYIIIVYLAQGYSGLWLGKLIVEKLAHGKINAFVEMLIGITVLALLAMIPWVGMYIGLLSLLLGLGLFMQSIKPNRKKTLTPETTIAEAEVVTEEDTTEPKKAKETEKSEKIEKTEKVEKVEETEKSEKPADKSVKSEKSQEVEEEE